MIDFVRVGDLVIKHFGVAVVLKTTSRTDAGKFSTMYIWTHPKYMHGPLYLARLDFETTAREYVIR
jgi:hypothetical protein